MTISREHTPIVPLIALLLPTLVILLGISLSNQDKIISLNSLTTSSSKVLKAITSKESLSGTISLIFGLSSLKDSISMVNTSTVRKGDVYFLSHGGPPTIEQTHSAPYKAWEKFGKLISADPPKGIAVVSAHWENESDFKGSESVIVNSNSSNPLIYDFYGFPKHYYEFKFSSSFTPQLENSVLSALEEGGVSYTRANRGFDHGVWLPFKAALGESTTIPIIQISLPGSSDPGATIKLGKALSKIRDEGYSIVTTGQAVHNLRDLFSGRKMTYAKPFLNQLDNALSTENAISSTVDLLKSSLYKQAHPTNEHFYPIFAALGALSSDPEQREKKEEILFGLLDMSGQPAQDEGLGWAMWRWVSP